MKARKLTLTKVIISHISEWINYAEYQYAINEITFADTNNFFWMSLTLKSLYPILFFITQEIYI